MPGIQDERGFLLPVNFQHLNFTPVHYFLVQGRAGTQRGGHAHRNANQVLLRISGEITVELVFKGERANVTLCENANAMMIAAPVWSSQTYHGDNAAIMVFSDHPYDPQSYLNEPAR